MFHDLVVDTGPHILTGLQLGVLRPADRDGDRSQAAYKRFLTERNETYRRCKPPKTPDFPSLRSAYALALKARTGKSLSESAVRIVGLDDRRISPFRLKRPGWWNAYDVLRHQGLTGIEKGSMRNALWSLAGLCVLIYQARPSHISKLFESAR
jgi:hypothetical protein